MHHSNGKFCCICKKDGSKLVAHYLCDQCLVHLVCCNATAEKAVEVVPLVHDVVRKAECDICLEEYQEDELQQHWEMCMARLVFRCTVCDGDYISKEGLWNHLDLHEISAKSKTLYSKEIRVRHKLHKCILCNDQRDYQESLYWQHVHEDHDGFFLRCAECGESFRSLKLQTDHTLNHCKARIPSNSGELELVKKLNDISHPLQAETTALISCEVMNPQSLVHTTDSNVIQCNSLDAANNNFTNPDQRNEGSQSSEEPFEVIADGVDSITAAKDSGVPPSTSSKIKTKTQVVAEEIPLPFAENQSSGPSDTKCPHCEKYLYGKMELIRHIENCHEPTACDVCGITLSGRTQARYHKTISHKERKFKCPHCSMKYHLKSSYQVHLTSHLKERKFPCKICGNKFKAPRYVAMHMRRTHHLKGDWKKFQAECNEKRQQQKPLGGLNALQIENIALKDVQISAEETTLLQPECQARNDNCEKLSPVTHCPICGENFKDEDLLTQHVETIHQLILCTICGKTFASTDRIKDHKLICSLDHRCFNGNTIYPDDSSEQIGTRIQKKKSNLCLEISASNVSNHNLMSSDQEHEESQFNMNPPKEGVSDDTDNEMNKKESDVSPTFSSKSKSKGIIISKECSPLLNTTSYCNELVCDICRLLFHSRNKLAYHKLKKHSDPKLSCPHCPKKFHLKSHYRRHLSSHAEDKMFTCDLCGQKYKDKEYVAMHMKRVHRMKMNGQSYLTDGKDMNAHEVENKAIKKEILVEQTSNLQHESQVPDVNCDESTSNSLISKVHCPMKRISGYESNEGNLSKQLPPVQLEEGSHYNQSAPQKTESRFLDQEHSTNAYNEEFLACEEIEIKEEMVAEEASVTSETWSSTESSQCHEAFSDRNELHGDLETSSQLRTCSICGLIFDNRRRMLYHKMVSHTKPLYKCSYCPKMLHFKDMMQRHEKIHKKNNEPLVTLSRCKRKKPTSKKTDQ